MKAMILAAGLGTRLKPWTLHHPKALVPVGGTPMLAHVISRLKSQGFDSIAVNVHHFAGQIKDFLASEYPADRIGISDESDALLDTGGGLLKATPLLCGDDRPYLVHNVDILSDAPLADIMKAHEASGRDISLVTSPRESTRRLVFGPRGELRGWHNMVSGEFRPAGFVAGADMHEAAFSGIYAVSPRVHDALREYSRRIGSDAFPIMDFLLDAAGTLRIGEIGLPELNLIDIGKPATLSRAGEFLDSLGSR